MITQNEIGHGPALALPVAAGETSAAPEAPRPRLRDSLIVRIGAVLLLFIALITAALFLSLEYFVSKQLREMHANATRQRVQEIEVFLRGEAVHMQRMLELASTDSDLIHSAHYHLGLRGQDNALRDDVERVARTFSLSRLQLRDATGRAVLGYPAEAPAALFDGIVPAAAARREPAPAGWVWQPDGLWAVATARVAMTEGSHAYLAAARPLASFGSLGPFGNDLVLARADPSTPVPPGAARFTLPHPLGEATHVDISFPDTVSAAIAATQKLLVVILAIGGALLLVALAAYLHRTLRPIRSLTGLAGAVGQGRFARHDPPRGNDEVSRMVHAFNRMVGDIARLRSLEERMHHDQRLAAMGQLATKVAHDINNPLTIINNVASLLAKRPGLDPQDVADLRAIVENCERCTHIVDNLLRFGQPLRLRLERVELAPFCRQAVARAAIRWPSARLRLIEAGSALAVRADRYHLDRVIDNLLNNAYQACPEEEIVVECGSGAQGAYVAVIDGGRGFSPEAMDHLFEPFFTTKAQGVGLGLASCLAVARAHDGDLRIQDAGKGHVTLWLPLAAPDRSGELPAP